MGKDRLHMSGLLDIQEKMLLKLMTFLLSNLSMKEHQVFSALVKFKWWVKMIRIKQMNSNSGCLRNKKWLLDKNVEVI